jgi:hypothetical protein
MQRQKKMDRTVDDNDQALIAMGGLLTSFALAYPFTVQRLVKQEYKFQQLVVASGRSPEEVQKELSGAYSLGQLVEFYRLFGCFPSDLVNNESKL